LLATSPEELQQLVSRVYQCNKNKGYGKQRMCIGDFSRWWKAGADGFFHVLEKQSDK